MLDDTTVQSAPQSNDITSVTPSTAGPMTSSSGIDRFTDPHSLGTSQSKPTSDPSLAKIQAITTSRIKRLQAAFDLLQQEQGLDPCTNCTELVFKLWKFYCEAVNIFLSSEKSIDDSCNDLVETALLLRRFTILKCRSALFWRILFSKTFYIHVAISTDMSLIGLQVIYSM